MNTSSEHWKQAPPLRETTLAVLAVYGYVPGHYVGPCRDCGETVMNVEKRNLRCWECALAVALNEAVEARKFTDRNAVLNRCVQRLDSAIADLTVARARLSEETDG